VSPMAFLIGSHLAERLNVPLIQSQLAPPVLPTNYDLGGHGTPLTAVGAHLKALGHLTFHSVIWSTLRKRTNMVRKNALDLPPLSLAEPFHMMFRRRVPLLAAYSPVVSPRLPDWGDWIHVTGYWFLDDHGDWRPPADLVEFLGAGPRPMFVGFGSTPFPDPEKATTTVVRALTGAGCRGIILAGGSGLSTGRLSDDILSVDSVPHDWLFPRSSAAVHHGGAGVTGAALRAGLPAVVVPIFADQPFWGSRVFGIGAGPRPIPAKRLTAKKLQGAIEVAVSDRLRRRAADIGEKIRQEDGVANAVRIITALCDRKTPRGATYSHVH